MNDQTRRSADGQREARALELFEKSLDLPDSIRVAWLAEQCGEDKQLLTAVMGLSEADASEGGILDRSAAALVIRDFAGVQIGPWELREEIGAGGMGRVYRAKRADGAFEQAVAIKLFDARFSSAEARARFEAERQILAALDHPGIARVVDGGTTEEDIPYVVMELVTGSRIDEYCEDNALDLRARLRLMERVCAAVEHAHERGVVHRDLKPGNVLVTHDGRPKVIDFGIAKVIEGSDVEVAQPATRTQGQILTPEYASPEQVRAQPVTPASDVYSLGILFYEILTGTRPYRLAALTPAQVERSVCESMPADPSDLVSRRRVDPPRGLVSATTLKRQLAGDLDRIVMTALSKEPERRYATAAGLGADIARYLAGQPVAARGASNLYRAGKFVQRHRPTVIATLAVIVVLVLSLIAVVRQAAEAERQRDLAQQEAERATAAKNFLVELIGRSDPFENSESASLAGALRQSLPGLEERFSGQPALEAEMRYQIGYALQNLGEIPPAREQMERALELREAHGSAIDQAESLMGLGIIAWWESDFERGETRIAEALEHLGDDASQRGVLLRVNALANLAGMRIDGGSYAESVEASEAALAEAGEHGFIDAELRATIWGNLANAYGSLPDRIDDSIAAFERALPLQREATGEMHPNFAIVLNNLALTHYAAGNLEAMLPLLQRSLEIRRETLGPDHPQTATALFNLAGGLVAAGHFEEAEPPALEALKVAEAGFEPGHPRIGKAHEKLAQVYAATDRTALARDHASTALAIYQAAPGVDQNWITTVEDILAALRGGD